MGSFADMIEWLVTGWGGVQGIVWAMFMSALFLGVALDSLSAIYTAYNRACMRLENESWLRNNCRDPVFFSNMRAHTTVCSEVESNARVGAFWAALREVSDDARASLQPLIFPVGLTCIGAALLIPLCCLCSQRFGVAPARRLRCLPMHRQSMCLKDV